MSIAKKQNAIIFALICGAKTMAAKMKINYSVRLRWKYSSNNSLFGEVDIITGKGFSIRLRKIRKNGISFGHVQPSTCCTVLEAQVFDETLPQRCLFLTQSDQELLFLVVDFRTTQE